MKMCVWGWCGEGVKRVAMMSLLLCGVFHRRAAEEAEFQARLELIKAEAAQKKAAGVSL
jgi:hypothetical protein